MPSFLSRLRLWFEGHDDAGVEQVETAALSVLLGLGAGLDGDDRDVAAARGGVGEPGRQQGALDAAAPESGCGPGAGELGDAVGDAHAAAAGTPSNLAR